MSSSIKFRKVPSLRYRLPESFGRVLREKSTLPTTVEKGSGYYRWLIGVIQGLNIMEDAAIQELLKALKEGPVELFLEDQF